MSRHIAPQTGILHLYVEKKFGYKCQFIDHQVNIGAAPPPNPCLVAPENIDRLMMIFVNEGAANVWLRAIRSGFPALNVGMLLPANGGTIILIADDDADFTGYEFWGFTAAAPTNVYWGEVVGVGR